MLFRSLKTGYIKVKQANNGQFSLSSHTRGNGGGAVAGAVAGWTVRFTGWGAFVIACYFEPHLALDTVHASQVIEASATVATAVGLASPLP